MEMLDQSKTTTHQGKHQRHVQHLGLMVASSMPLRVPPFQLCCLQRMWSLSLANSSMWPQLSFQTKSRVCDISSILEPPLQFCFISPASLTDQPGALCRKSNYAACGLHQQLSRTWLKTSMTHSFLYLATIWMMLPTSAASETCNLDCFCHS